MTRGDRTVKTIHKKRLLDLATFLDVVPNKQFRLEHYWVSVVGRANGCGTVACACGWAARVPSLRKQKFRIISGEPAYGNLLGWKAVNKFFGLTQEESEWLFYDGSYRRDVVTRPAAVAARIRQFVTAQTPRRKPAEKTRTGR